VIGRNVRLVARREIRERAFEKSFLISTGITLAIIICVVVIPPLLGVGGTTQYVIGGQNLSDAYSDAIREPRTYVVAILIIVLRLLGWSERIRRRAVILRPGSGIPYGVAIAAGALIAMALQR
jgi:hypothetical protein